MGGERARIVGSILALIILTLLLNELQLRIGNTALSELQNMSRHSRDHVILSEVEVIFCYVVLLWVLFVQVRLTNNEHARRRESTIHTGLLLGTV